MKILVILDFAFTWLLDLVTRAMMDVIIERLVIILNDFAACCWKLKYFHAKLSQKNHFIGDFLVERVVWGRSHHCSFLE